MRRTILALFTLVISLFVFFTAPRITGNFVRAAQQNPGGGSISSVGESACRFLEGTPEHGTCTGCFSGGGSWTAIGCLGGADPTAFVNSFIKIGTGLGGGIAFLLILFSGFQTMMSAGNPEKLHAAKELMTAAISGLLLIIFSIFLLRLIGVDILQIPGFS